MPLRTAAASAPGRRWLLVVAGLALAAALAAATRAGDGDAQANPSAPPPATADRSAPTGGPATAGPATSSVPVAPAAATQDTRRPAQPIEQYQGQGPKVAVIGDSISYLARDEIGAVLRHAGFAVSVTGLYGYTATGALPTALAYVDTHPDVVVVELGTNDATELAYRDSSASAATFPTAMRSITDAFPDACVVVTTVTTHRTRPDRFFTVDAWNGAARGIDDWVRRTYPNVVDWDAAVREQHQAGSTVHQDDEVHPNAAGTQLLAQLDLAAVRRCAAR